MKKKYILLIVILLLLVAFRIYLPTLVKNYVNDMLQNIEGYTGSITDVDLALYRGAYRIDSLYLFSTTQDLGKPFFKTDAIDLSVSWKDLFKGALTAEVILEKPELNFVAVQSDSDSIVTGEGVDWTQQIKSLLPISINLFRIKQGRVNYLDNFSDPKVDLYVRDINFDLGNIRNVDDDSNALPSPYTLSAVSLGQGQLNATGKANLLRQIPNFDLDLKFENADLTAFNNFFLAYAFFDFEKGDFSLYSEFALVDSTLDGYVKPILNDLKVLSWKDEEGGFFNKIYQGVVGGATQLLKNQRKDQTATEIPISGTLSSTKAGIWQAVIELLKNAFINPLKKTLDERIRVSGKQIIQDTDDKKKKQK